MINRRDMLAISASAQLLFASPAFAGDPTWEKVSGNEEYGAAHFIDTASISRNGDVVTYNEKAEFANSPDNWKQVEATSMVNCRSHKWHTVRLKITTNDGDVRAAENPDKNDWNDTKPGTVAADVQEFVCSR